MQASNCLAAAAASDAVQVDGSQPATTNARNVRERIFAMAQTFDSANDNQSSVGLKLLRGAHAYIYLWAGNEELEIRFGSGEIRVR